MEERGESPPSEGAEPRGSLFLVSEMSKLLCSPHLVLHPDGDGVSLCLGLLRCVRHDELSFFVLIS